MTEEEKAKRQQEILEKIKQFRLIDDTFMTKVFEDYPEGIELLLHIILQKPDLRVIKTTTQSYVKSLQGRSAIFDALAEDSSGQKYDIEVQRADKGAGQRRARYNLSLMDANAIISGEETEKLPETYVIFITENDVLGLGQPRYIIERTIKGTDQEFNDGSHIIYVNGACREGDSPLALLMQDFFCSEPGKMNYKLLADRARYFKEDDKGVSKMCKVVEDMINDIVKKERQDLALKLLSRGKHTYEEIAEDTGLTMEDVLALAGKKSA